MLDNSVTIKAPSVEQAVKIGLSKLNITEDQAVVTVINEGKKGLFGFGKQDAIVEISAKTKISLNDLAEETTEVEEVSVNLDKKNAKITLNEEVDDILIADLINNAGHYKVKNITEIAE